MRYLMILAVLLVGAGTYSATAQTTTSPVDAIATAQSALVTAQAGLRTPTIAPTATKAATATTIPTATPRPTATITVRPTATATPERSLRGTATTVPTVTPKPTATRVPPTPTTVPTVPPSVVRVYRSLAVIPTTFVVDGVTVKLSAEQLAAAKAEAAKIDQRIQSASKGMGRATVTVVVSNIPVTAFHTYCSTVTTICGKWIHPVDIKQALTLADSGSYDFVHTYVPRSAGGKWVYDAPVGGLAMTRYFSNVMYGTATAPTFQYTTQLHEAGHVIGDYHLRKTMGFTGLPSCGIVPMHCPQVWADWSNNQAWMNAYFSGTVVHDGVRSGINQTGWNLPTMTQRAQLRGAPLDDFEWTGRETPIPHEHGAGV